MYVHIIYIYIYIILIYVYLRPKGKGRKLDAENADAAEFAAGCDMPTVSQPWGAGLVSCDWRFQPSPQYLAKARGTSASRR